MQDILHTCPPYGQNSLGVAKRANGKPSLVRIEHIGAGFMLHCREVDTLKQLTIHASDFDPMPNIPSKYREYNFQALAPYWAEALRVFPKTVVIKPVNLSPETLARKLRESRVAKDTYHWKHPSVDEALWALNAEKITVALTDTGNVTMGERSSREIMPSQVTLVSDASITLRLSNIETRESFCSLISQRVFDRKHTFVVLDLDDATIADLESRYDIGFVPRDDSGHNVIF